MDQQSTEYEVRQKVSKLRMQLYNDSAVDLEEWQREEIEPHWSRLIQSMLTQLLISGGFYLSVTKDLEKFREGVAFTGSETSGAIILPDTRNSCTIPTIKRFAMTLFSFFNELYEPDQRTAVVPDDIFVQQVDMSLREFKKLRAKRKSKLRNREARTRAIRGAVMDPTIQTPRKVKSRTRPRKNLEDEIGFPSVITFFADNASNRVGVVRGKDFCWSLPDTPPGFQFNFRPNRKASSLVRFDVSFPQKSVPSETLPQITESV